jgi:carboxypeptidase PM20D1
MFDTLAPEMGGFSRVALSNLWLFGPVVQRSSKAPAAPTPCCAPPRR